MPGPYRGGVDHREDPRKPLGAEVVPHQARGDIGGVLTAELSAAWALLPQPGEPLRAKTAQLQFHRCRILPAPHRGVVGEGHMAGIEHVLQQGQRIHRQVPEGVLHHPARLFQLRDQG